MSDTREVRRRAIKVLVVDDSNLIRQALGNFIADLPGMEVVGRARDGQEALEMDRARKPDVVIMDLRMPGLDGLVATAILKHAPAPPAVVVCTTEDDPETRAAVTAAGADAFLLKRDLGACIEGVVRALVRPCGAGRRAQPPPLRIPPRSR